MHLCSRTTNTQDDCAWDNKQRIHNNKQHCMPTYSWTAQTGSGTSKNATRPGDVFCLGDVQKILSREILSWAGENNAFTLHFQSQYTNGTTVCKKIARVLDKPSTAKVGYATLCIWDGSMRTQNWGKGDCVKNVWENRLFGKNLSPPGTELHER